MLGFSVVFVYFPLPLIHVLTAAICFANGSLCICIPACIYREALMLLLVKYSTPRITLACRSVVNGSASWEKLHAELIGEVD